METITQFLTPPADTFFLFAPRGAWKSTLMKARFPDAFYVELLDPETVRTFSAKPERLAGVVRALGEQIYFPAYLRMKFVI